MGSFIVAIVLNGTKNTLSTPSHNIIIFLLCIKFFSFVPLAMMVTYRAVSFSEHLHHISILALDMVDAVS